MNDCEEAKDYDVNIKKQLGEQISENIEAEGRLKALLSFTFFFILLFFSFIFPPMNRNKKGNFFENQIYK